MSPDAIIGIDASRSYRGQPTGTERYSRRLIEQLLKLPTPGVRYRLYFNDPPPPDADIGDVETRSLPARRFWTHRRLASELRRNPVDLLFVPAHVLPLTYAGRSVVTIHDLGHLYEPDSYSAFVRLQLQLTTRWNARRAERIIAISESTRQDLIRRMGVAEQRVVVTHLGVDDHFQSLDPATIEQFRDAFRLPSKLALFVGTIQPRKNLARLIEAFELVADRDQELHLVLAGKIGWLSDPITKRIQGSRHNQRIRLLGHVPDQQLSSLYNSASVLVLPALYEGFGLPVIEAMACGVPVVTSNRGALPELSGADSLVVDPMDIDSLATAIDTQVSRRSVQQLIESRVRHARSFGWRDTALETREVLLEALGIQPESDK